MSTKKLLELSSRGMFLHEMPEWLYDAVRRTVEAGAGGIPTIEELLSVLPEGIRALVVTKELVQPEGPRVAVYFLDEPGASKEYIELMESAFERAIAKMGGKAGFSFRSRAGGGDR